MNLPLRNTNDEQINDILALNNFEMAKHAMMVVHGFDHFIIGQNSGGGVFHDRLPSDSQTGCFSVIGPWNPECVFFAVYLM